MVTCSLAWVSSAGYGSAGLAGGGLLVVGGVGGDCDEGESGERAGFAERVGRSCKLIIIFAGAVVKRGAGSDVGV